MHNDMSAMTEKQLIANIDAFVSLGNKLDAEIKRRYGRSAWLFHEADGGVYAMAGDSVEGTRRDRQKHIRLSSTGNAGWGAGAW